MLNLIKRRLNENYFLKNGAKSFASYYTKIENSKAYLELCFRTQGIKRAFQNNLTYNQFNFLFQEIDESKSKYILDLGCGNGHLMDHINSKFNTDIIGVDFAYNGDDSRIKPVKYQELNLEENSFDLIYSLDSFYLVKDEKHVLKKLFNSLKNNGKIIFFHTFKEDYTKSSLFKNLTQLTTNVSKNDFTQDDLNLWKTLQSELVNLEEDFFSEQRGDLYRSKLKEVQNNLKLHKNSQLTRLALVATKTR